MNFEGNEIEKVQQKMYENPNFIKDYDKNIGGVDKYDQLLHSYFNKRKNKKWTNKFAIYFIMLLTHKSFVLYRTFYSGQDKINNQLKFRMYLISFLSHSNKNINENTINEKIVGTEYPVHFPREIDNILLQQI
ncbi:hypothetical protein HZS_3077 [Henneguya salminicola]|nr:hypothetical protein HZS_3077 [Henneguya salminicola]